MKNLSVRSGALDGALFKGMMLAAADYLENYKEEINGLNVFPVPDGDTGDNTCSTVRSGAVALIPITDGEICAVLNALKSGMLLGARGNSGVILSQLFAGFADGLSGMREARISDIRSAMKKGVQRAYDAVSTPTEGTILTVAREGVLYADGISAESLCDYFDALAEGMRISLERTPDILPILRDAGVVDSGGAGLYRLFLGLSLALKGEISIKGSTSSEALKMPELDEGALLKYGYCTELLVRLQESKCDPDKFSLKGLREFLSTVGDSAVAFKEGKTVKLHVHTFTPHSVLEYMGRVGAFIQVKIENMSLGHSASGIANADESLGKSAKGRAKSPDLQAPVTRNYKIIAVSHGGAQSELLRSAGADIILTAKRGESPSAKGFFDKIRGAKSSEVFIFPNDKNAILAAKQAAQLYGKARVYIIPSTNIAECYAALSISDPNASALEMKEGFERAVGRIKCALLSPAVKGCSLDGIDIKRGDTVGIIRNKIVTSDRKRIGCALTLIGMLVSDESSLLTVFRGKGADKRESRKITDAVRERYPRLEVCEIYSAEEIYPYIFSAE